MKSTKRIGIVALVAAILFGLTGCPGGTETPHEHTFADEWKSDEANHWHEATCEHTDAESGKAAHEWDKGQVTKEPTKEAEGEMTFTCTVCERTKTESIPKLVEDEPIPPEHEHKWDEGKVTKEATETEDGEKTFTCTVCKETKTEAIPAKNHVHNVSDKWSSDEKNHWHEADCKIESHNTNKDAHTWDKGKVTKEPTKEAEGEMTFTCTVCERTKTESIPAVHEHKWDEGKVTKEATETEDGERTFTCTVCKETKTEAIPAKNHVHNVSDKWSSDEKNHWHEADCKIESHNTNKDAHTWDKGKVTKEPTTESEGEMTFTCAVCERTKTESIPKLAEDEPNPTEHEHTFTEEWKNDKDNHWHEATCEHTDAVTKEEHKWDKGEVTKEATCTDKGVLTYTCTVCKLTKTEDIAATGHKFAEEWKNDKDDHWHEATCGHTDAVTKEEHNWDKGEVTTEPTIKTEGLMTYTCTVCEKTKTEPIGKLSLLTIEVTIKDPVQETDSLKIKDTIADGKVTLTAASGFAKYVWYVDGEVVSASTENTLEIDAAGLSTGIHSAMVVALDEDGKDYSANCSLKITR